MRLVSISPRVDKGTTHLSHGHRRCEISTTWTCSSRTSCRPAPSMTSRRQSSVNWRMAPSAPGSMPPTCRRAQPLQLRRLPAERDNSESLGARLRRAAARARAAGHSGGCECRDVGAGGAGRCSAAWPTRRPRPPSAVLGLAKARLARAAGAGGDREQAPRGRRTPDVLHGRAAARHGHGEKDHEPVVAAGGA